MKSFLRTLLFFSVMAAAGRAAEPKPANTFFTQKGTDPAFATIKDSLATKTKSGVQGSKIEVNHQLVEVLPEAKRPIEPAIKLHTLLNSSIPRRDFDQWSRWYQEDGNTQVFRLFKGEVNLHNNRALAGRVEAFSQVEWKETDKRWHQWSGVVTPIKPLGSILQVKNADNDWGVMISVSTNGKVLINHRRGQKDQQLDTGGAGRQFLLGVRDDGLNYEVYLNKKKVAAGSYKRPTGHTVFRWGMYVGEHAIKEDAMVLFSGVTVQ